MAEDRTGVVARLDALDMLGGPALVAALTAVLDLADHFTEIATCSSGNGAALYRSVADRLRTVVAAALEGAGQ